MSSSTILTAYKLRIANDVRHPLTLSRRALHDMRTPRAPPSATLILRSLNRFINFLDILTTGQVSFALTFQVPSSVFLES